VDVFGLRSTNVEEVLTTGVAEVAATDNVPVELAGDVTVTVVPTTVDVVADC